jgi:hypothetical protein
MTTRDVRDVLLRNFEGIVERHGVARSKSHACALELLVALRGQGISTLRPANHHDPNADWRRRPEQTGRPPADADPDDPYYAARLYVTGNPPTGAAPPPEGSQLEIPLE